jgi:hypothetical protein
MAVPTNSAVAAESGPGARCPEAQADGVPCAELGTDCEICGRAYPCPHAPTADATGAGSGAPEPAARPPQA